MSENYFKDLLSTDVSKYVEKKNGLSYVSWAFAWGELKQKHPEAFYTVYENSDGWNYFTDGRTCWVKTGVTVNGLEHIEYLPVMDFRNKSIPANAVTSFDVNKTIQRSLTKACARHGLGLTVYAGEDIWAEEGKDIKKQEEPMQLSPEAERERDKEVKDVALKIEQYNDLIPANQKSKVDEAVKEKNLKYLKSILAWCVDEAAGKHKKESA